MCRKIMNLSISQISLPSSLKCALKGEGDFCKSPPLPAGCRPKAYHLLIYTNASMPLFSLTQQAQRKKLGKKETPFLEISRSAEREEAYAASTAQTFEKV